MQVFFAYFLKKIFSANMWTKPLHKPQYIGFSLLTQASKISLFVYFPKNLRFFLLSGAGRRKKQTPKLFFGVCAQFSTFNI